MNTQPEPTIADARFETLKQRFSQELNANIELQAQNLFLQAQLQKALEPKVTHKTEKKDGGSATRKN